MFCTAFRAPLVFSGFSSNNQSDGKGRIHFRSISQIPIVFCLLAAQLQFFLFSQGLQKTNSYRRRPTPQKGLHQGRALPPRCLPGALCLSWPKTSAPAAAKASPTTLSFSGTNAATALAPDTSVASAASSTKTPRSSPSTNWSTSKLHPPTYAQSVG